ncbi:hypothetical protein BTW08_18090 [Salinicola sp. MH3R3-1]|uniref:DUF4123 domain-containing protein n=1 Tax=Salinicola sp. MH3R3-1 TaxID=1928762 RepID=UPI00094EBDD2|nr:DUF4123 domain-containing protein [Salinicola sp. MH3R3-1]OLO06320.1 hypothetical protein BTW08_18090 [Salinicola sp. MH3R3-1]
MQLIDHYAPEWITETQAMVEGWLAEEPRSYVYLLLDASFKHETTLTWVRENWPEGNWRSLYQDAPNTSERVLAISPLLLLVDKDSLGALEAIAKETSGQPMLSLVVSTETLDLLWERLAAFRIVTVQDARYVLRLTDARRLSQIAEMLSKEQRALLMSHMTAWCYIGRDARWRELALGGVTTAEPDDMSSIRLDDRQTQILLDMNRIDALIDGLRRHESELHDLFDSPSRRHEWVVKTLDSASLSAADYPEQVQCCRSAAHREGWLT